MPQLPQFTNDDKDFQMMQTKWASIIAPFLNRLPNNSNILKNVALVTGSNTINHKLGRPLTGWIIIRKRAAAEIYDTQDSNQSPDLTLVLVTDANVTVDIEVF